MVQKLERIVEIVSENSRKYAAIAGASALPYLAGLTLGAMGKNVAESDPGMGLAIQIAPLALGFNVNISWGSLFYTLGVATNYVGRIC